MTLDEAIEHAEWCARESQGECAEEHRQLAEWLSELKRLKAQNKRLRRWYTALGENQKKAFAESCKTATNNLLKISKLSDENKDLRKQIGDADRINGRLVGENESLKAENAKLRELVRDMCICMCNITDADYTCKDCLLSNDTRNCDFERRMEELGIEC